MDSNFVSVCQCGSPGRIDDQLRRRGVDLATTTCVGANHALLAERPWGTLQDRLVTELRLAGITTNGTANAFLPGFLLRHNLRFAVPPFLPTPSPPGGRGPTA